MSLAAAVDTPIEAVFTFRRDEYIRAMRRWEQDRTGSHFQESGGSHWGEDSFEARTAPNLFAAVKRELPRPVLVAAEMS